MAWRSIRRLSIVIAVGAACLAATFGRANALVEYCPAWISRVQTVGMSASSRAPAALWAYTLSANGARTVSGTVLAQTSAGWFEFAFDGVTLPEKQATYENTITRFKRLEYESVPLFVRFPKAVRILRWWVDYASATGDESFGWSSRGNVHCLPTAGTGVNEGTSDGLPDFVRSPPESDLSAMPPPGVPISVVSPVPEPAGMTACATPFTDARVLWKERAAFPPGVMMATVGITSATVAVEVFIGPNGHVDDASLYYPSGNRALDTSALNAAEGSTYAGGTALCQPSSGSYLFVVTFEDGGGP
jgi:hypothetical protein